MKTKYASLAALTLLALLPSFTFAQFSIPRFVIAGGGGDSAAGSFAISGTIGQPEAGPSAGPMTGGTFSLTGGFWPGTAAAFCPSDFNKDGFVTGDDFDQFVVFFIAGTLEADFNGDGFVTGDDFDEFVVRFIAGC